MKNLLFMFLFVLVGAATLSGQRTQGKASYYADRFHGRPTSTGETYDKNAYTAASKEFPVGTVLRVTNVANKQVTQVRINDCGPHHPERIIDLSRAAAQQIGLLRAGVAVVNLEVLALGDEGLACDRSKQKRRPPTATATATAPVTTTTITTTTTATNPVTVPPAPASNDPNASFPTGDDPVFSLYGVQIAAYGRAANADDFVRKSGNRYGNLFKRTDARLTRIFVGPFLSENSAKAKLNALKKGGVEGIVRRVQ